MNPEEQGIMLSAYLDGELDEAQRLEVEKMLEADQELAEELGGMKLKFYSVLSIVIGERGKQIEIDTRAI